MTVSMGHEAWTNSCSAAGSTFYTSLEGLPIGEPLCKAAQIVGCILECVDAAQVSVPRGII